MSGYDGRKALTEEKWQLTVSDLSVRRTDHPIEAW